MNVHVSMPSLAMTLVNLDREQQLAKQLTLSLLNRSLVDQASSLHKVGGRDIPQVEMPDTGLRTGC